MLVLSADKTGQALPGSTPSTTLICHYQMRLISSLSSLSVLTVMGGYSYKSGWGGGRKDKVFLKEILGRIRNFGKKCLFFGGILPILGWF